MKTMTFMTLICVLLINPYRTEAGAGKKAAVLGLLTAMGTATIFIGMDLQERDEEAFRASQRQADLTNLFARQQLSQPVEEHR